MCPFYDGGSVCNQTFGLAFVVRQKHSALFNHFSGIFPESNFFSSK